MTFLTEPCLALQTDIIEPERASRFLDRELDDDLCVRYGRMMSCLYLRAVFDRISTDVNS